PQGACTQFIADFTDNFIGDHKKLKPRGQADTWPDGSRVWPPSSQCPDDIATGYATFVNVLMRVGYVGGWSPPVGPSALGKNIWQYLQPDPTATPGSWKIKGWPDGTTPSTPPTPYYDTHLVEISVILDRLLQAINSFDVGNCRSTATEPAASAAAASAAVVS